MFAAFSASLVTIALVRFAYPPLLPQMINAHWFAAADLVSLSAASLIGYLGGALSGRSLATRLSNVPLLRASGILASLSLFACAFPLSVTWFFVWRALAGFSGGVAVVLVAATTLPHFPVSERGRASGLIFLGLGVGIILSGTLVPLLLHYGIRTTWIGVAAVAGTLSIVTWQMWPPTQKPLSLAPTESIERVRRVPTRVLTLMYIQFALMAVGMASAMLFLSDFVSRRFLGDNHSAITWAAYGFGSLVGPILYGIASDRFTAIKTLRVLLVIEALVLFRLVLTQSLDEAALLSAIIGTFVSGIIPVSQSWIREVASNQEAAQNAMWSQSTVVYASTSAACGYGFTWMIKAAHGDYRPVFIASAVAMGIAFVINIVDPLLNVPENRASMAPSSG